MDYVSVGASGLKVSRLILGAMGFGDPSWRSWVLDAAGSRPIIHRALELGINAIDTCDFYSSGRSEEIVGDAVRELGNRNELVIATKAGMPMGKGPNAKGFSRKHLFEAIDASLKRLKTDYVDLYQTHIWDPKAAIPEMMEAFDALVRSGRVLHIGITDMPCWQFATAQGYAAENRLVRFISIQNHYNPIWREDERELMPYARAHGIGLIPYSPMGRGYLCGRGRRDPKSGSERFRSDDYAQKLYGRESDERVADAVLAVGKRLGVPPAQVSLAWTLSRPGVNAPMFGATRVEHVEEAVKALSLKLDAADIAGIDKAYDPRPFAGHGI